MSDFAELYPIPLAVAKDRQVGKLVARTERLLEETVARVSVFPVQGPLFRVPAERFRPGSVLHVLPATPTGPTIELPPALEGVWFDVVNRSAVAAFVDCHGSELVDGVGFAIVLAGTRRRFVATAAGVWSSLAS